jgi:flagellar biogenesis protein FliO
MDFGPQLLAAAMALGLSTAALWWLRRRGFSPGSVRRGRRMASLERLPLTPRHSLHLVRVDERVLLVGCSPSGCVAIEAPPGAAAPRAGL